MTRQTHFNLTEDLIYWESLAAFRFQNDVCFTRQTLVEQKEQLCSHLKTLHVGNSLHVASVGKYTK